MKANIDVTVPLKDNDIRKIAKKGFNSKDIKIQRTPSKNRRKK